jgi:phosphopantetheine--protein transferase-like protein
MQTAIRVFFTDIKALSNERLQRLYNELPSKQKNKAFLIKNAKKRREFIVGRTLLVHALSNEKTAVNLLSILESPSSAPTVFGGNDCYISISHSAYMVCCVLHSYPIGIDIEYAKNRKNLIEKSDFFMTHQEMEKLKKIERDDHKLSFFYEVWCAKEAFFKAFDKATQTQTSMKSIKIPRILEGNWSLFQKKVDNYYLSLAYRGGDRSVELIRVDLE